MTQARAVLPPSAALDQNRLPAAIFLESRFGAWWSEWNFSEKHSKLQTSDLLKKKHGTDTFLREIHWVKWLTLPHKRRAKNDLYTVHPFSSTKSWTKNESSFLPRLGDGSNWYTIIVLVIEDYRITCGELVMQYMMHNKHVKRTSRLIGNLPVSWNSFKKKDLQTCSVFPFNKNSKTGSQQKKGGPDDSIHQPWQGLGRIQETMLFSTMWSTRLHRCRKGKSSSLKVKTKWQSMSHVNMGTFMYIQKIVGIYFIYRNL